jgi:hypothetical protein
MYKQFVAACMWRTVNLFRNIANNHFRTNFKYHFKTLTFNYGYANLIDFTYTERNTIHTFSLFKTAIALQVSEAQSSRTHHRLAGATTADTNRVISVTTDAIADILGRLCRWHRQICDLVDMVAACYGLLLFIMIMYCFTSSVLATYEITTFFHRTKPFIGLRPIIDCVTCGCRLILISVIPSMTVAQVSRSLYFNSCLT